MYKTLTLAALLGAAAASMTNTGNIIAPFNIGTYYSGSLTYTFDAGYGTQYNPSGPMAPGPDNSQTYAFNIFSYIRLTYTHEAFQAYTSTYDWTLNLLDFTPYGQTVTWSRFDHGDGFHSTVSAFRNLNVLNFNTRVREVAKTCMWSLFTSTTSITNPTCAYNQDKVTDYMDPVW
jgi:hypothetical protein